MKRLELLDCGRFIAACCVMMFHYFYNGISNLKISSIRHVPEIVSVAKYGYLGVEFFFMISGYVIFFSARNRSASEFAVSRAVRLFPAFWAAVLFTSTVAYFWGAPSMSVGLSQMLTNLTMIPQFFGFAYVDGVYWTLQLELSFYGLVLLCLLVGWQERLRTLFLLWPAAMLLAYFAGMRNFPLLGGYYYYFAAGALFAVQKESPSKYGWSALLLCLYFCVRFSLEKAANIFGGQHIAYSPFILKAVTCASFAFFLSLNSKMGSSVRVPGSKLMGSLTYPLYLVHAHFGYMFISRFATEANKWGIYLLAVSLSMSTAYLIHRFTEKKYAAQWHGLFSRSLGRLVHLVNIQTLKIPRVWSTLFSRS